MIYNKLLFIFVFYQGNGERDYWSGVGEAALVGGLTSVAYGGTVGRALKTSGKYADVQAVKEEIEAIGKKRSNLYINDKLTDAQEDALQKSEVWPTTASWSVSQTHADIIKREINLDVSGFEIWIDGSSVIHIEERHGKNGKADQSMQDINDVARVADVVNHADDGSVLFDENGEPSRDSV
jgi:hypothetical protein